MSKRDYESLIAALCAQCQLEGVQADENGLLSLHVDEKYELNIQYVEATNNVFIFIEVTQLPHDVEPTVYRELLCAGLFGKDTAGGYFTLEPESNAVIYNYQMRLEEAERSVDAFSELLENMLQLVEMWEKKLQELQQGAPEMEAEPAMESDFARPFSDHMLRP